MDHWIKAIERMEDKKFEADLGQESDLTQEANIRQEAELQRPGVETTKEGEGTVLARPWRKKRGKRRMMRMAMREH